MRIVVTSIAFFALLVIGFFACSSSARGVQSTTAQEALKKPGATNKLPAFAMTDANGNAVDLSSFKGKKVFVNLWATWCPPCRAEMPSIEELAAKVAGENTVFVMLSLDDNFEVAKKYAKTKNLKVPVYYPAENLPALFKTDGIPVTFIFNETGELVMRNMGSDDYNRDVYIKLLKK